MASGASIRIDDKVLKRKLAELRKRCDDQTRMWESIGQDIYNSIMENFMSGGRPTKWKERSKKKRTSSSESYYERMQRLGKTKILVGETEVLMGAINARATAKDVSVGTSNVKYAATHQFGRGSIPARPFVMLQPEDMITIAETIEDYLTGAFSK